MKNITSLVAGIAALFIIALATPAFAKDVQTVTGEGKCAKCALHETDKCQNVIETEKDGKKVTYYLTGKTSQAFHHDNLCKESQKVTATGNVTEKNGKTYMHVTKIDLAK